MHREKEKMMNEGNSVATAESMDLVVSKFDLGELATNAQALLETVKLKLQGYSIENYTEDNIDQAKKDKAELNAAAEKLNKKRIELEFEFNKPFTPFKTTIAEICSEIKSSSRIIDTLVKEVEDREKKKKESAIYSFYDEQKFTLFGLVKIFNQQWLNKTYKMKDIQAEILAKIAKTQEELETLEKCGEPDAKAFYLQTLDLNMALSKANELKTNRERIAEAKKQREAPVQMTAREAAESTQRGPLVDPLTDPEVIGVNLFTEETLTVTLKITGTREALKGLREYIDANGLKYEKVNA